MPQLSFVIPTLNEGGGVRDLLERLQRDFPRAERIVVDGGSRDATVANALQSADVVLLGEPGRAAQMNLGASVASGRYLCFLHADTWPAFGEEALLRELGETSWGFCRIELRSRMPAVRVVAACMNKRSALTRIATGDQMLVVDGQLFRGVNGFASIPLMEDVELCKRLRQLASPRRLPLRVSSSARRWERDGVVATVLLMWALRLAFWLGVSPQRLWQYYYGRPPADAVGGGIS